MFREKATSALPDFHAGPLVKLEFVFRNNLSKKLKEQLEFRDCTTQSYLK